MDQSQVQQILDDFRMSRIAQDYALGQLEALEAAFGTCLAALRQQPELIEQIQSALGMRASLVGQGDSSLAMRDGFESMQRRLQSYMDGSPPRSVHTAEPGALN